MGRPPTLADLHVVILGYGDRGEHVPLVESLLDEGVPPERVTLAHNPSARGGEPTPPPGGTLIQMGDNVGYGRAVNAALREHVEGAELVLVLTHDSRIPKGTVAKLVEAAGRAPEFGILGPVLWSRGGDGPWSYGGIRLASGWPAHRSNPPAELDGAGVAECDWVDGAAMLVRRQVFESVGLFEERFFMYFEETDLCLRARNAGWRVGVVVDAPAEQSSGVPRRPGAYAYLATRNGLAYARSAGGVRGVLRVARLMLRHALYLARRRAGAEVAGTLLGAFDFLRGRWGAPPAWLPGLGDLEVGPRPLSSRPGSGSERRRRRA